MDSKATGEFIAELRKAKGMTQKQLANTLSVTDKAVSRWETGKGLPDISSLLALSELFSVTVNELLYGHRIEKEEIEKIAEVNVVTALSESAANKKKSKKSIIIISVIAAVYVLISAACYFSQLYNSYFAIMGSDDCVVAADYSYMTYYGEKYVPLPTDGWVCQSAEQIIPEAKVEGKNFLDKMLFGESVYAVFGCEDNDLVILRSDYDYLVSEYYCKESRYEYYCNLLKAAKPLTYYIGIPHSDIVYDEKEFDGDLAKYLLSLTAEDIAENVDCDTFRRNEISIPIFAYDESKIFSFPIGEVLLKKGEYYWFDYGDIPKWQDNADYSNIHPYIIGDEYDELLDEYFSYMYE